jgi:hypothetical protein
MTKEYCVVCGTQLAMGQGELYCSRGHKQVPVPAVDITISISETLLELVHIYAANRGMTLDAAIIKALVDEVAD